MVWDIDADDGMVEVKLSERPGSKASTGTRTSRRGLPALYRLPDPPSFPVPKRLNPYVNHSTLKLIKRQQPSNVKYKKADGSARLTSRQTASGHCDPARSLAMDQREAFPELSCNTALVNSPQGSACGPKIAPRSIAGSAKSRKEGSTMLPKYPIVSVRGVGLGSEAVYDKINHLRKQIKSNIAVTESNKAQDDYVRTTQDFYRMNLDRVDKLYSKESNEVKNLYLAYFTNTRGSKKAIYDCLNGLDRK